MISRRQLLGASAAGLLAGLAGVAVTRGEASIRLIGRGSTILSLLDTGSERVLIVLGDRDDGLLENIPGLKTLGNTRVDLVIASHRLLANTISRQHLQLDSTPALSVQASASLSPIRGEVTPAVQGMIVEIGSQTTLHLQPSHTVAATSDQPEFLLTANCLNSTIVFASGIGALRSGSGAKTDLVVSARWPNTIALDRHRPLVVASNGEPDDGHSVPHVQIFRSDPTVIEIGNEGLLLREAQLSS